MTKEEIALAKELDLLTYFKLVEPGNLKLVGKEYRHKVHSSLTISKDSLWCWHCIGLHGRTALKYLIDVEKVPYVEAVREINRIQGGVVHSSQPVSLPQPRAEPEAPRDFKLPKPASFAARQYGLYHMAPDKTAQSIDVSLGMRMSAFNIPSIMKICEDDTIHLEELASDKKVALFVVTPDTTTAYNFLAAVMFQQCFQILVHSADNREDHCLPRHVRFLLDEFPNIGMIPDFQILISTIRSRNIGCTLIYQSIAQLKSQYGDDWGTILENCDSELVLGGGNNPESLEFFGKQLGKRTIEVLNTTENLGAQGSFSKNYQVASRDLMTPEEIRTMPRNRCLLMISGVVPFYSYKFDLKKHPNYALVEKEGHRPFDYERRAENNFAAFMKNVQEINNIELDDDESDT